LAKGDSNPRLDCSGGFCGPTVDVGENGQVTGGANDQGTPGGGYSCDF